ncbi:MAG: type IV pilus assembly protein PilM [Candidatus Magasanikbacteria bacterium]|nr:type IV pilus assembly protein PilM [Candidatus Magasanikbacteria bacterium]
MFINNPFPGAFGLDIGDLSVKLMQMSRHSPLGRAPFFTIEATRAAALPPGAIVNGEIQLPEIVRKKILHLLGADGNYPLLKSPWVVANLPEPKTFLKLIEIETPAEELTDDDIVFQAAKHLPFDMAEGYLDWQVTTTNGTAKKTTAVLIAAVQKTIADSYTYLLEAAGLSPLALEVEAVALSRALITATKDYSGMARVILDLGGTRSGLTIYDKNTIQFSTSINFSGELITTALMQGLSIDHAAAEKLKIATGAKVNKESPKYLKIIDDLIDQLVGEIKQALQFYREHFAATNPITHITMCGGLSYLENLDTILSHALRISAHPGNVWKNVSASAPPKTKPTDGLELATVVGLALRAAQNPLRHSL